MRFLTAGESHGPELTAIIEGLPANLPICDEDINQELRRRQQGYGRGGRMAIEKDQVKFMSGVRHGKTLGSPVALVVENRDWENWQKVMSAAPVDSNIKELRRVSKPRPGHADLVGGIKYQQTDLRNILERSSARETTMRVAVGAIAKKVLKELDIEVAGHVLRIGGVAAVVNDTLNATMIREKAASSEVSCVDALATEKMKARIDEAKLAGDTLGGIVEVVVENVPVGLGSHVQWDTKLDAKIAQAILSINAFKGVEFGVGFEVGDLPGSKVMDEIVWSKETGYSRSSNQLGGFEGGMTNGQPIIVRGAMKPIPTLKQPLASVNIDNHEPFTANYERSDCCAVPAACVVAESVVATEIVQSILEKFDSDDFETLKKAVANHRIMTNEY